MLHYIVLIYIFKTKSSFSITIHILLKRVQSNVIELNWTQLAWFSFWRTD